MPVNAMRPSLVPPIVKVALLYKTCLLAFCALVASACPGLVGRTAASPVSFASWDIAAYVDIAQNGYQVGTYQCAFYPLWPLCIRCGATLVGGNYLLSAWLLCSVISLYALWAFYIYLRTTYTLVIANRTILLLVAYPGALFLSVPYAESLFFLLLALCLVCIGRGWLSGLAVCSFLLPLTRPTGLFVLCIVAWSVAASRRYKSAYGALACGAPLLGFVCYLLLMRWYTGNPFAGFAAQSQFPANGSLSRMLELDRFVVAFFQFGWAHDYLGSWLDRIFFVGFCCSLPHIWRLCPSYYCYALLAGFVTAVANSYMSEVRFLLLIFPLFIVWAAVLSKWRLFPVCLGVFTCTQAILLIRFLSGRWAG